MTDSTEWTYYRYGGLNPGALTMYVRRHRDGTTEGLNVVTRTWVALDAGWLTRYIENGESSLTEMTRDRLERVVGGAVPA